MYLFSPNLERYYRKETWRAASFSSLPRSLAKPRSALGFADPSPDYSTCGPSLCQVLSVGLMPCTSALYPWASAPAQPCNTSHSSDHSSLPSGPSCLYSSSLACAASPVGPQALAAPSPSLTHSSTCLCSSHCLSPTHCVLFVLKFPWGPRRCAHGPVGSLEEDLGCRQSFPELLRFVLGA